MNTASAETRNAIAAALSHLRSQAGLPAGLEFTRLGAKALASDVKRRITVTRPVRLCHKQCTCVINPHIAIHIHSSSEDSTTAGLWMFDEAGEVLLQVGAWGSALKQPDPGRLRVERLT
jgi:hypothetical protein